MVVVYFVMIFYDARKWFSKSLLLIRYSEIFLAIFQLLFYNYLDKKN